MLFQMFVFVMFYQIVISCSVSEMSFFPADVKRSCFFQPVKLSLIPHFSSLDIQFDPEMHQIMKVKWIL